MSRHNRRLWVRVAVLLGGYIALSQGVGSDEPRQDGLANPFFAMNFALHVPSLSLDEQAALLKDLGYRGSQYLGSLEDLDATLAVADEAALEVFTAAVVPYDVPVDPGATYAPVLKDAIRKLQGRKTLLLIQFVSSTYDRSSKLGDERAVELGRELADFARPYGVRLAIYHHVNIWCERVDHAARIAKQCDRENLGVCFNLFHWIRTDPDGDLDQLVRETMPHLFLVTINGATPDGGYATLDHGAEDVERFLQPFVTHGYRGPIGLQCVAVAGEPRDNLTRSMEAWNCISAHLATVDDRGESR